MLLSVNQEPLKEKRVEQIYEPYYLVFPKLGIRKEIYHGLDWLDEYKICSLHPIHESSSTIFLFGHNHSDVFHFLYEVDIGDIFFLEHLGKKEAYQVMTKKIISVSEKDYLEMGQEKELRLFTCTRNSHTRLFVQSLKTT